MGKAALDHFAAPAHGVASDARSPEPQTVASSTSINSRIKLDEHIESDDAEFVNGLISWLNPGFPMWDRPNQESMVRIGLICNQVASDARQRANLVDRGPIVGRTGLKKLRWLDFGRTDAVRFIVDRCSGRHAGHGFGLRRSMRRRMSANRSRAMTTSAIWNVT
jgi:hypothetical protein